MGFSSKEFSGLQKSGCLSKVWINLPFLPSRGSLMLSVECGNSLMLLFVSIVSMFTFSALWWPDWVLGIDSGKSGPCLSMSRIESYRDLNLGRIGSVSFFFFFFFHKHSITSQNSVRLERPLKTMRLVSVTYCCVKDHLKT